MMNLATLNLALHVSCCSHDLERNRVTVPWTFVQSVTLCAVSSTISYASFEFFLVQVIFALELIILVSFTELSFYPRCVTVWVL